jgi:hypothetical protein
MEMSNLLMYNLNKGETLLFYGNELNSSHDFRIICNGSIREIDTLLFFDSRGISKQFDNSLVIKVISNLPANHTFLLVSRPLEITTWMTLFNFIHLNKIKPKRIITNMGFVDFTPKKMSIIEKSIFQYDLFFSRNDASLVFLEKYQTQNEGELDLFQQIYPKKFTFALEDMIGSCNMLILNTPLLVPGFFFERNRPTSFFNSILKTNQFNHSLKLSSIVIDFKSLDNDESYDGVHYTEIGNIRLFSEIQQYL